MFRNTLSKMSLDGDTVIVNGLGFEIRVEYDRISSLRICKEEFVSASEMEVPIEKVLALHPEFVHQYRIGLSVDGVGFRFTVPKDHAQPLIDRHEAWLAEILKDGPDPRGYVPERDGPREKRPDDGVIMYFHQNHGWIDPKVREAAGLPLPIGALTKSETDRLLKEAFAAAENDPVWAG